MRIYPLAFDLEHNKSSKSPVYLLKQYMDKEKTIAAYFTSSELCELPDGVVRPEDYAGPVLQNALRIYLGTVLYQKPNDYFGRTTVMSDDGLTLMVGTLDYHSTINEPGLGGADVFYRARVTDPFVFGSRIVADLSSWLEFGYASTMSGDGKSIAISAPGAGLIKQYARSSSGTWTSVADFSTSAVFRPGITLSYNFDGSVLALGAPEYGTPNGGVFLIQKEGPLYTTKQVLSPDATLNFKFGSTVKLSSDGAVLFIGALTPDNRGTVYRYDRPGALWVTNPTASSSVQGPTPTANYYFGTPNLAAKTPIACSYDGSIVAVGELAGLNKTSNGVGVVHIYNSDSMEFTLVETVEATAEFTSAAMEFGGSVHMTPDGKALYVGADLRIDPITVTAIGGVNVFKRVNDIFVFEQHIVADQEQADMRTGYCVTASSNGSSLALGAPYYDEPVGAFFNNFAGLASVYLMGRDYVFEATVINPQGVFQGIDRLSGTSTLGSISLSLIDYGGEITSFFAQKLVEGYGLRDKVGEFYRGYPGIAFSDYVLFGTQKVGGIVQGKDGLIDMSYIEIAQSTKSAIFDVASTNLSADVLAADTVIECYNTLPFGKVEHGPQYKDAPMYATGTVAITLGSNVVTGTGTSWLSARIGKGSRIELASQSFYVDLVISNTILLVDTPLATSGSGVAYKVFPSLTYLQLEDELISATDSLYNLISVTSTSYSFGLDATGYHIAGIPEATQFPQGCRIAVTGSVSNDGPRIVFRNDIPDKLYITGTFVVEVAGPAVNVLANIQFINCTRGVRGSVAVDHVISPGQLPSRQPKIQEVGYLTMPGPMMAIALLSGIIRNQSPVAIDSVLLPYSYHLGIDTQFIDYASFENVGDDIWRLSDQSGVIFEFFIKEKEEGKRFLETEIYRILGSVTFVSDDGRITYKQLNSILFDSATIGNLNRDNSIFGKITHDMPNLANQFVFDWDYDPVTEKPRERDQLFDLSSSAVHGRNKILHYAMRGINRDIYTKQFIYNRFDSLRDGYAGPPVLAPVQALPSQDKYQVGDVVFVESEDVRDLTNPITGTLARAMEVQKASMDFPTGRLVYDLFGSSRKSELIISQLSNFALNDTFYSVAGGRDPLLKLDAIGSLTTSVDAQGILHITAAAPGINLYGHATDSSFYEYWYDGPVAIDPGVTVTANLNIRLYVMGVFYMTSTSKLNGKGGNIADVGYVGNALGGGGLIYSTSAGPGVFSKVTYHSTPGQSVIGSVPSMPYFNIGNIGGDYLTGLPRNLMGTKGLPGGDSYYSVPAYSTGGVTTSVGGLAGDAGAGVLLVSRGVVMSYGSIVDLSGTDGLPGVPVGSYPTSFDAGVGAGGCGGGLLVIQDGKGSYAVGVETSFTSVDGAAVPTSTPMASALPETAVWDTSFAYVYTYYVGNSEAIDRSQSNLRIQRLPDPV